MIRIKNNFKFGFFTLRYSLKFIKKLIYRNKQNIIEPVSENADIQQDKINKNLVGFYVASEQMKSSSNDAIMVEYTGKIILFGYIVVI